MAFPDGIADFRSDTVTRPTAAMLKAMAEAPLGDDVYHDDPTVNALEEGVCGGDWQGGRPSTPRQEPWANQLSVMLHTNPGEEILANEDSHVRSIEAGAPSGSLRGWIPDRKGGRAVASNQGTSRKRWPWLVSGSASMRGAATGIFPPIRLMVWENTHNMSGGRVIPIDLMEKTNRVARSHSLAVHIDGARIFNAVAATGVPAERYSAVGDTIQFCFSKGLGAPVGSIVCGPQDMIDEIRFLRKRLGRWNASDRRDCCGGQSGSGRSRSSD